MSEDTVVTLGQWIWLIICFRFSLRLMINVRITKFWVIVLGIYYVKIRSSQM